MTETQETDLTVTNKTARRPGVCIPWEEKVRELPPITADPTLVRQLWENGDALAYMYIWQLLVSF